MTPHTSFDLGHEVVRQPQVIEGLSEGLGGVLRLAAVARETLVGFEVATLSSFGVFFGVSVAWGHGALLDSVWICEDGVTSASACPLSTSCFLWSTMCGINAPARPVPFPHRLLHAALA